MSARAAVRVALGFAPDLKPFRAHVTVARKVVRLTRSREMRALRWPVAARAGPPSAAMLKGSYTVL